MFKKTYDRIKHFLLYRFTKTHKLNVSEVIATTESARVSDLEGTIGFVISSLRKLDQLMIASNLSRQERREFWRQFANSSQTREEIVLKLAKRIRKEE